MPSSWSPKGTRPPLLRKFSCVGADNQVLQLTDGVAAGPQAAAIDHEVVQGLLPLDRPVVRVGVRQNVDVVAMIQVGRIADLVGRGRNPRVGVVGHRDLPVLGIEHGEREAGDLAVDLGGQGGRQRVHDHALGFPAVDGGDDRRREEGRVDDERSAAVALRAGGDGGREIHGNGVAGVEAKRGLGRVDGPVDRHLEVGDHVVDQAVRLQRVADGLRGLPHVDQIGARCKGPGGRVSPEAPGPRGGASRRSDAVCPCAGTGRAGALTRQPGLHATQPGTEVGRTSLKPSTGARRMNQETGDANRRSTPDRD